MNRYTYMYLFINLFKQANCCRLLLPNNNIFDDDEWHNLQNFATIFINFVCMCDAMLPMKTRFNKRERERERLILFA